MMVAPVAAMPPVAVVVMAVAPAMVTMAPMAAVMTPMPVMVVAMTPVARMVAMTEMVVLPLHRLDRRLRSQSRRRGRCERGGVGDAPAEEAAGHQREGGEREARATR